MLIALIITEVILTLLLVLVLAKFRSNLPEIEVLYQKLVYINKELKDKERIDSEAYNKMDFKPRRISMWKLQLPSRIINKKKFECKTYESAARDYSAYFRPLLIIFAIWAVMLVILLGMLPR